jgi:hypothetical protein
VRKPFALAAVVLSLALAAAGAARADIQAADAVNARAAQSMGFDGRGGTVVVIDPGGFDTSSPGLQGKLVGEACFNTDNQPNICPNGQTQQFGAGAATVSWPNSYHGTEMAELISNSNPAAYGVAPGATVFVIRVGGPNGTADKDSARDALGYVYFNLRSQFNILSIAMPFVPAGFESASDLCTDPVYRGVVDSLWAVGIGSTMGAGNNGYFNGMQFDGCRSETYAISAFNQGDTISATSNYSQDAAWGAVAGPNTLSTAGPGQLMTLPNAVTSIGCGLSAGALAVLKTYRPNARVDAMVAALLAGGQPIVVNDPNPGSPLPHYTLRRIDVSNAINYLTSDYIPETGFWWNPNESGRGYFIDVQGNVMYFGAFMYNPNGPAEWYVGRLTSTGPATYAGNLTLYGGGQVTGSSAYKSPSTLGSVAGVQLRFSDLQTGTFEIETAQGPIDVPITRYRLFYDGQAGNPQRPQTGWYWDPTKPGSGIAIEGLGNAMFMVAFGYDATGHAMWTAAEAESPSPQFVVSTQPILYANGQSLTGGYQAPVAAGQPFGTISLQQVTPHLLNFTYANGLQSNYMRFRFLDP